ncbi:STAS-like domain-containing protein [Elusimicrobiota bacterium]
MKIQIKTICGKNTVTRDDGKKIRKLIKEAWAKDEIVELDFGNLIIASVSFMDEAVGVLALKHTKEEITIKIRLKNINPQDKVLLNDILLSRFRQKRAKSGQSK